MASIKIVASDLFVKSAHFFLGGGFSPPFALFLGFKDCNATKSIMICFHKLKRKEKKRRKKT